MTTHKKFLIFLIAATMSIQTQQALALATGSTLPECALSSLGKPGKVDLKSFKGQVLYVDFWASWCGPCAKSFPFMNELQGQLGDKGLRVVGINLDENLEDAKTFLQDYPASFTVAADDTKQCAKDFAVQAMPSSYLVDRQGNVHHIHLGFRAGEAEELRQVVEKLLVQ